MDYNPDPTKQAQEVLFSRKLQKVSHPKLFFNNPKTSWSGIRFQINIS